MDKKAKKRVEVLRKRVEKLTLQITGAKTQADDPAELQSLEDEMAKVKAEIAELKAS